MKLQVVGCSHHVSSVAVRERLAFNADQTRAALMDWRDRFPGSEAVLLSTCNRTEVYTANEDPEGGPSHEEVARFLVGFHDLPLGEVFDELFERTGEDTVRHLFTVAASLDSLVVGEPQILAQVKDAYRLATEQQSAGPLTHTIFQASVRVARRVARETMLHRRRVSIPSLAVADFARGVFERFDDKRVVVVGAGEMAAETLRFLKQEGARNVTVVNRSHEQADRLAREWGGQAASWSKLPHVLAAADLVVSATGASEPVMTLKQFHRDVEPGRSQRPLVILDLAVPRDFEPAIGERLGVYLYSMDDLSEACDRNRRLRDRELPAALRIIEQESERFMADLYHRATGPIIQRLRQGWQGPKQQELERLLRKLPDLKPDQRDEIARSFDRLVNKLLHPPLESLRDESRHGPPHSLLVALKRLFQIKD